METLGSVNNFLKKQKILKTWNGKQHKNFYWQVDISTEEKFGVYRTYKLQRTKSFQIKKSKKFKNYKIFVDIEGTRKFDDSTKFVTFENSTKFKTEKLGWPKSKIGKFRETTKCREREGLGKLKNLEISEFWTTKNYY